MMSESNRNEKRRNSESQKKSKDVEEIVNRLHTTRKPNEEKPPDRRRPIEMKRRMSNADIQSMVERLHNSKPQHKEKSAYEQGGVMLSYCVTGWSKPGNGGKRYDF